MYDSAAWNQTVKWKRRKYSPKTQKSCDGVNKELLDDVTWPRGFGVGGNGNTEKDRQELERMKEDFEKKQKEIENRMKILQLEHELKEAELAAAADADNDDTNRSVSSKSLRDKDPELKKYVKISENCRGQRAVELMQVAGVSIPEDGAGIPELQQFQKHLNYKIIVYDYGSKVRNVIFSKKTVMYPTLLKGKHRLEGHVPDADNRPLVPIAVSAKHAAKGQEARIAGVKVNGYRGAPIKSLNLKAVITTGPSLLCASKRYTPEGRTF
ncbi:hypothetical protein JTB14_038303 [Gonioctena quinquepunctata]|nr:hypothetical protein JTB14_038303 [Gonioctena quinquepunctata]